MGQEQKVATDRWDRRAHSLTLVTSETAHRHDIARAQGRKPKPFGTGPENVALHRTIEHPRHIHAVMAQRCDEGRGVPMSEEPRRRQAFAFGCHLIQKPDAVRLQKRAAIRAHLRGAHRSGLCRALPTSPRSTGHHRTVRQRCDSPPWIVSPLQRASEDRSSMVLLSILAPVTSLNPEPWQARNWESLFD